MASRPADPLAATAGAGALPRLLAGPGGAILVVAATCLAYANSFAVPFQFDDGANIVQNAAVRDLHSFLASGASPRRWLSLLTFAVNGSLGGLAVAGYHAVNLLIHVLAALGVLALARSVAALRPTGERVTPSPFTGAGPALAALLFALHPVQTQAVTYVVQRMTSLAALLVIATVLLHARAVVDTGSARAPLLRGLALLTAGLSLLAKENAATVPLAVTAFDLAFLAGGRRERLRRLLPYFAVAGVLALWLLRQGGHAVEAARQLREEAGATSLPPWLAYLATQPRALLTYARLIIAPVGQSVDYDVEIADSLLSPSTLVPAAGVLVVFGLPVALAWKRRASWTARAVLFAVAWALVTLAVESSVIPLPDPINEHRLYLPLAGIALAAGLASEWAWLERLRSPRARAVSVAALASLALVLGTATFARNRVWQDAETLWSDTVAKAPGKARSWVWLAQVRAERGDLPSAIALLERAATLPHVTEPVLANLGAYLAQAGRLDDAERTFQRALALPGARLASPHAGLGLILLRRGEVDAACAHFLAAVGLRAAPQLAHANAGVCLQRSGDLRGAAGEWEEAVREDPSDAPSLFNLATTRVRLGEDRAAAPIFQRFLTVAGPAFAPQREQAQRWLSSNPGASAPSP